ncbi:MAG: radical SAM protein [Candidatus Melainabacteria bacterium]|nr:radical SAM protein [Candidatus Melainabacteria bacterium]
MFGNEIRLAPPRSRSGTAMDVAWCYPGSYAIGMAGLGYQLVWDLIDSQEDARAIRCFTDMDEFDGADRRAACRLFGFTLGWELDFVNVLSLLDRYGVALSSGQRGDDDPIVFGGGPVLSANPEPYADIFDAVLLGDAEATVGPFISALARERGGSSRRARLEMLARLPGVYVPSLYEVEYDPLGPIRSVTPLAGAAPPTVERQVYRGDRDYMAKSSFLSPDTIWGATFLIEVVRSCPQECRFCLASYLTRPFRFAAVDAIVGEVEKVRDRAFRIGLLGPSITEHPEFAELAKRLSAMANLEATIASVRADTLDVELVRSIAGLGQKSVTIALESGSERLRGIMKKNLSQEQIESALDAIDRGGLSGVKLYGIAGLPYETGDDLDETIRLLTMLKRRHKRLRFVFGLSSFVPKAQTPFQWMGRDRSCASKMEYLRKHLSRAGIDVRPESHNWSDIQALLSRGDRRLAPVLGEVGSSGRGTLGTWRKALKRFADSCPSLDFYAYRNIAVTETLPWGHLSPGAPEKQAYLERHLEDASRLALGQ